MEWGLGRLADILGEYDYQALDFLSCMALDVENCHTPVHSKKMNMSNITPVEGPGTQSPIQWCLLVTYR